MEPFIEYFTLIFKGAFTCLIIGIIIFLLAKKGKIGANSLQEKRFLDFGKKLIIFSLIIIPTYLLIKVTFPYSFKKKLCQNKEEFIKKGMTVHKEDINDSIHHLYLEKTYDYLYNKYGDKILYEGFNMDTTDDNKMYLILISVMYPNMSDSLKQIILYQVKNKRKKN